MNAVNIIPWAVMLAFTGVASGQPITNDVPINQYGMRLALCDNLFEIRTNQDALDQRTVNASKTLYVLLHNASTNDISILYPRDSPLTCEVRTQDGVPLKESRLGTELNQKPKSLKNVFIGIRSGSSPGLVEARDLPPLSTLFKFPSNGVYTCSLRHWQWDDAKRSFALSEAVRLNVIYNETNASAGGLPK
jgi:hypothetical protein